MPRPVQWQLGKFPKGSFAASSPIRDWKQLEGNYFGGARANTARPRTRVFTIADMRVHKRGHACSQTQTRMFINRRSLTKVEFSLSVAVEAA